MAHLTDTLASYLRPTQRGVGVKGGTEQLAHAVRVTLESRPDWCVLSVDIKNAFNSIARSAILRQALAHIPEVSDFVFGFYGGEAPALWLGKNDLFLSLRGVQQANPLGPALFALAFHPVLRKVRGDHPGVRVSRVTTTSIFWALPPTASERT